MFNFTIMKADKKPKTGEGYDFSSNLYTVSLTKKGDKDCIEWILKYIADAKEIKIINLDELKEWYCNKYFSVSSDSGTSISVSSCDAFYYSPSVNENHENYLIEFKNVHYKEFCKKNFCEDIISKAFFSRSLLLHTVFENNNLDYFREHVKFIVVYNYDQSSKEKTQNKVKNISQSIRGKKCKLETKPEIDYKSEATKNINKIIDNQKSDFKEVEIIKIDDFKVRYEYKLKNKQCKCC